MLSVLLCAAEARAAVPAPEAKEGARPVRVLLMASGPNRDYQFLRNLLVRAAEAKKAEVSVYLQSAQDNADDFVLDIPRERLLRRFPDVLDDDDKKPDEKFYNLAHYDVVIAFDVDWAKSEPVLLRRWVARHGGGLVFVAGPIATVQVMRGHRPDKF
jgi:hypothetical protein